MNFRTMVENKDTGGSAPGELDLRAVEADDSSKRSGVNPDGPTNSLKEQGVARSIWPWWWNQSALVRHDTRTNPWGVADFPCKALPGIADVHRSGTTNFPWPTGGAFRV